MQAFFVLCRSLDSQQSLREYCMEYAKHTTAVCMLAYLVHASIEVLVCSSLSYYKPAAAVESPEGAAVESLEGAKQ